MSKENLGFVERAIRKALPVTALAMLAFAGCSKDGNSGTVPEQLTKLHDKATILCTKDAKAKFAAKYPNVKISDNPTLEELQGAVVILEAKESEGPDFMQGEFDGCMKKNFDDVVAGLDNGTIVPLQDTVAPETTMAG
ncbi:hypothetical protein KBB49_01125 [Candidatus Saccharibacteria bacterium]|nr:hypothetical protein [Candidatus Saccharibacteria bacterium]